MPDSVEEDLTLNISGPKALSICGFLFFKPTTPADPSAWENHLQVFVTGLILLSKSGPGLV
jgi:hypothetical protein